jgi:uncharacterized repeat protein (TIGR04076 family)
MSDNDNVQCGRRVVARITGIRGPEGEGRCYYGHRVGEEFEIGEVCPKMCAWAFQSLFPFATALRFGGRLPWEEPGTARVSCPDPDNTVVFELRVRD